MLMLKDYLDCLQWRIEINIPPLRKFHHLLSSSFVREWRIFLLQHLSFLDPCIRLFFYMYVYYIKKTCIFNFYFNFNLMKVYPYKITKYLKSIDIVQSMYNNIYMMSYDVF